MKRNRVLAWIVGVVLVMGAVPGHFPASSPQFAGQRSEIPRRWVNEPAGHDKSPRLRTNTLSDIEQKKQGTLPPAVLAESFDGMGVGFTGPQGVPVLRNPSDNSLAVGPDHIVQTVNSRMAVFTKRGKKYPE